MLSNPGVITVRNAINVNASNAAVVIVLHGCLVTKLVIMRWTVSGLPGLPTLIDDSEPLTSLSEVPGSQTAILLDFA
jgi:hypothetical protein